MYKNTLLQFFAYEHLPEHLQAISKTFADLARILEEVLPSNPEKTAAFRKLLEAKDCAVRSVFFKDSEAGESQATVGQVGDAPTYAPAEQGDSAESQESSTLASETSPSPETKDSQETSGQSGVECQPPSEETAPTEGGTIE